MKKGILLFSSLTILVIVGLCFWYFIDDFRRQLFLAKRGNVDAQIFIANSYQQGLHNIPKNNCQSHVWWLKAAQQHNRHAQIALGNLFIADPNTTLACIKPTDKETKNYILSAIENGNYQGYYKLAEFHTKDIQQKIHYLEHGAIHNEPNALYALSTHYFSRNPAYSIHLLEKSAELNNIKAQSFLGDIYAGMTYTSKYMDFSKALLWYNKAAEQNDLTALKNLALLHLYGQGTEQSYEKAAYYLKKAADQGDKESKLTLAMLIMFDRGIAIHQYGSKNTSLDVIQSLASSGYVDAQVELARLYLLGHGVLQDYQKAAEWFQKAANLSDRLARYQLASLYASGKGVEKNHHKATELFYQSRYQEYIDTSKPNGKGVIDQGYPYFKVY